LRRFGFETEQRIVGNLKHLVSIADDSLSIRKGRWMVKIHFRSNIRWRTGRHPNCKRINRHNLAAGCSISLKFCMWVPYGFVEVVELFNLYTGALRVS